MWIFVLFYQEEEERELAVICLQKLLRGRAIQNKVFCVSWFMSLFRMMVGMIGGVCITIITIFLPQN